MKYIYIIDYWVPFPQSEYGGVVTLIAEDDTEAFDFCSTEHGYDQTYVNNIMPNVVKAHKIQLADDYESAIIDAFTT